MSTVETPVTKQPAVIHKSGDWIYPNGYPNMPHDGSLKPTIDYPNAHATEELPLDEGTRSLLATKMGLPVEQIPATVTWPGEAAPRFQIPYAGDPALTAEQEAYLVSINHGYTLSERPEQ